MLNYVLNTHNSEVDDKDTITTSFTRSCAFIVGFQQILYIGFHAYSTYCRNLCFHYFEQVNATWEGYEQFKNINVWFLPPIPDSPPPIIMEGRNLKIWQNFLGSEFFLTLVGEINLYVGSKNYLGWGRGAGGCNICYYTFII